MFGIELNYKRNIISGYNRFKAEVIHQIESNNEEFFASPDDMPGDAYSSMMNWKESLNDEFGDRGFAHRFIMKFKSREQREGGDPVHNKLMETIRNAQ